MNRSLFKYIIITSLVILCSCGSRTYEWVKINQDKVDMAKRARPYSATVRYVDVKVNVIPTAGRVIDIRHKDIYFANPILRVKDSSGVPLIKTVKSNHPKVPRSKCQIIRGRDYVNASSGEVLESDIDINVLNNAIIFPIKKKVEKAEVEGSAMNLQTITTGREDSEDTVTDELKAAANQPISDSDIKKEEFKRINYMWIGLVLLIVGLIIGLIFGSMAYLISAVGIVFLLIGYFTKT